jgi:methionyl-tRNA formyltransferase
MRGEFSTIVLQQLLAASFPIAAVIVPAPIINNNMAPITLLIPDPPVSPLPLRQPHLQHNSIHLAWQEHIPVFEMRNLSSPAVVEHLAPFEADAAVVACFPWRVPSPLLSLPHHGFFNLHPSLLPQLRGPFPLFWAFRLGKQQTGVTIHKMDTDLDTGAIALQQEIILPEGISGPDADRLLAEKGADLIVDALRRLASGTLQLTPQPEGGNHYPRPTLEDFLVPTTWSARRAFNFMRGTAEWNTPFRIKGPDLDISVRQALSFTTDTRQEKALLQDGRDRWIQFSPGVLHAR